MNLNPSSTAGSSAVKHQITHFLGLRPVLTSLFLILLVGFSVYRNYKSRLNHSHPQDPVFMIPYAVIIGLALLMLIVSVIRYFSRPKELVMNPEFLIIDGRKLYPAEIKCIMLDGWFNPAIAVKPKGALITPRRLTFRFKKFSNLTLYGLTDWAKQHGLRVINRRFMRWI